MNFGSRGGAFEIEIDQPSAIWHALKMKPYGHLVSADLLTSGTHLIVMRANGLLEGGADPRREGLALGIDRRRPQEHARHARAGHAITVVGAGITGLWQALTLARRGHRVRLIERAADAVRSAPPAALRAPCWRPIARLRRPPRSCSILASGRSPFGARVSPRRRERHAGGGGRA